MLEPLLQKLSFKSEMERPFHFVRIFKAIRMPTCGFFQLAVFYDGNQWRQACGKHWVTILAGEVTRIVTSALGSPWEKAFVGIDGRPFLGMNGHRVQD
jgi:hypothetical protein